MRVLDRLLRRLPFCQVCGVLILHPIKLCGFCYGLIKNEMLPANIQRCNDYEFSSLVLWHWSDKNHILVRALLQSLKGSGNKKAGEYWGAELAKKYLYQLFAKRNCGLKELPEVVVPCPAKVHGQKDHAFYLAKAVSDLLEVPMFCDLKAMGGGAQKMANKALRKKREFQDPTSSAYQKVLFVDDIITTGATVLAAYRGLGRPEHFFALALAERSLLRRQRKPGITQHDLV